MVHNLSRARRSILQSLVVAAIVDSTSAFSFSPLSSHDGMISTTNSPSSSSLFLPSRARRQRRRSSLDYRSSADDVEDTIEGLDRYFDNIMKGNDNDIFNSEYSNNIIEQVTEEDHDEEEEEEEDPLSRALTRRTAHHHDHFPDAVRDLLSSIPLPTLPPHWIVTSEAMEAIVGGAGGSGVLMHLHNAGRALGLHDMDLHDMDGSTPPPSSSSSSRVNEATATKTTTNKTKKIRKGVVDTAKAFVPVAVEIGVVDTLARYFS